MYRLKKTPLGWVLVCYTSTYQYPATSPMDGNAMVAHLEWIAFQVEYYSEVDD